MAGEKTSAPVSVRIRENREALLDVVADLVGRVAALEKLVDPTVGKAKATPKKRGAKR